MSLVLFAACAKRALPEEKVRGFAKFALNGGAAISQASSDEYNPYVIQMGDNYLVLVFGSNRSCGGCSGHNLFIAKSVSAYNNNSVFPAFNSPTVMTVASTPLNYSGRINFAVTAVGNNVRIHLTNAGGTVQATPNIAPDGPYDTTLATIANASGQTGTVIGYSNDDDKIISRQGSTINAYSRLAAYPLTAIPDAGSAATIAAVDSTFTSRYDGFFALAGGQITSMSYYGSGGKINAVNTAIAKSKITPQSMTLMQGGGTTGSLMFISGTEAGGTSEDLFVVDGLTVWQMWQDLEPKPPGAPAGGGGGGASISWATSTMPSAAGWYSVTYGGGTFVAVSNGTSAATSTDGMNWTARSLPSSGWFSVAYGNSTFVAVASSVGTSAMTSADGITWTGRTLTSAFWNSVAFGHNTFVAVSYGGTQAATSPDGITWTLRTLPVSANWYAVTYANGQFLAVANGTNKAATSPDGITWTVQTLPVSSNWNSVVYGNSVYVAVSGTGTVAATSPDGITWTQRTLPASANWRSVAFGNGMFTAVATGSSSSAVSTDGINWTLQTLPASANWYSVTFGNGIFASVANNNATAATTSTAAVVDTIAPTVTSVNSSTGSGYYKSGQNISIQVVFSEPVTATIGGGNAYLSLSTGGTATYTSGSGTNTLTFTYSVMPAHNSADLDYSSTSALTLVAGATIKDAAGNNATLTLPTPGALYSLGYNTNIVIDNVAPTISAVAPATSANVTDTKVSYTLSEFVASGSVTWTRTGGSADGTIHTQALTGLELTTGAHTNITLTNNPTLVVGAIYTVTFNATDSAGNVATTVTSTGVTYTTLGSTWTARTMPSAAPWQGIAYGNGIFAAISFGSTAAASSTDGVTWTARTLPSASQWSSIAFGNNTFVTVSTGISSAAASSTNGTTWTARSLPASTYWRSVAYGNATFVTVAGGPSTYAATSPDGITWTLRTLPSSAQWYSVAYGNGTFVAVTDSGTTAATSPDGITWTLRTMPASARWLNITFGSGIFVALDGTNPSTKAATSPDGITWTLRTLPNSLAWRSITSGNGVFIVGAGSTNLAAQSTDGITWTSITLPSTGSWNALAYGNGMFVAAVASSTAAATSP